MPREKFAVPIPHQHLAQVEAWIDTPQGPQREAAILLAHGAGAAPDSAFLETLAAGLVELGFSVLRFAYPYMQRRMTDGKQRPPDRAPVLEACHRAVLAAFRERVGARRVLLAGKSLGGRMSSHLAAQGEDCAGLIFFGYPLHPAKRPDKLRSEHFAMLCQPALFLQGTRDALCDLELLEPALKRYGGSATLHVVEGCDHGFKVLKRSGRTQADVHAELLTAVDEWERRQFPA